MPSPSGRKPSKEPAPSNVPGSQVVTLRDLAAQLGVSPATVSLALRDIGRISPERRAAIKKAAAKMGYRPEPMARALVQYRINKRISSISAAIAWVNSWDPPERLRSHKEFNLYWEGAYEAADAAGYRLEEFLIHPGMSFSRLQNIFLTRNIRGVIIPPQPQAIDWGGFDWDEFSAVRIGHSIESPEVYVVAPDQVGNALLAFDRIKERGYQRIGMVCGIEVRTNTKRWFSGGYLMAQLRQPASQNLPLLALEQKDREKDRQVLAQWMRSHRPDAILTEVASLPDLLKKNGAKVPQDVALAALSVLDGNISAGINQNPRLVGVAASEILIAQINRNQRGPSPEHRTATVQGSWVEGGSLPRIA